MFLVILQNLNNLFFASYRIMHNKFAEQIATEDSM